MSNPNKNLEPSISTKYHYWEPPIDEGDVYYPPNLEGFESHKRSPGKGIERPGSPSTVPDHQVNKATGPPASTGTLPGTASDSETEKGSETRSRTDRPDTLAQQQPRLENPPAIQPKAETRAKTDSSNNNRPETIQNKPPIQNLTKNSADRAKQTEPDKTVSDKNTDSTKELPPRFKFQLEKYTPQGRAAIEWEVMRVFGGWENVDLNQPTWDINGRMSTLGDAIITRFLYKMGRDLDTSGSVSRSVTAGLLVTGGMALGFDAEQLNALGELGEAIDGLIPDRAAATGARQRVKKRWSKFKKRLGLKASKAKSQKSRSKKPLDRPIRPLSNEMVRELDLTEKEKQIIKDSAEVFRDASALVESAMPNARPYETSTEAHLITQMIIESFHPEAFSEPETGVSKSSRSTMGDIRIAESDAMVMIELKRTAFLKSDGTMATKGSDSNMPGQTPQTESLEIVAEHQDTHAIIINKEGRIFYFSTRDGWKKGN